MSEKGDFLIVIVLYRKNAQKTLVKFMGFVNSK